MVIVLVVVAVVVLAVLAGKYIEVAVAKPEVSQAQVHPSVTYPSESSQKQRSAVLPASKRYPAAPIRVRRSYYTAAKTLKFATSANAHKTKRKMLYLTYDDGPDYVTGGTEAVVKVLEREHVPATFFMVTNQLDSAKGKKLARRIARDGFAIGSHSTAHADMTKRSTSEIRRDFSTSIKKIRKVTGVNSKCIRLPYGAQNSRVRGALWDLNVASILWSVDPNDWQRPGANVVAKRVISGFAPGAILLSHDGAGNGKQAAAALTKIIHAAKKKGYTFGLLDCAR